MEYTHEDIVRFRDSLNTQIRLLKNEIYTKEADLKLLKNRLDDANLGLAMIETFCSEYIEQHLQAIMSKAGKVVDIEDFGKNINYD